MKRFIFVTLSLVVIFFISCFLSCSGDKQKAGSNLVISDDTSHAAMIKHGEYLVTILGCNDCHSPKKMGARGPEIIPEKLLSGFTDGQSFGKFDNKPMKSGFALFYPDLTASAGPWGISFADNLTPDTTGIGSWTKEQFKKALTQGKYKGLEGTRMLLPPMPWQNYAALPDKDVESIFDYLKSIKPVKNVVPQVVAPDKM